MSPTALALVLSLAPGQALPPPMCGLQAFATLDFANIGNGGEEWLTMAVPGAAVGSQAHCEAATILPSHLSVGQAYVSAAGVVSLSLINHDNTGHDPAATLFRCVVFL